MRRWNRQIDNDINFRRRQQPIHIIGLNAKLIRPGLRRSHVQIGNGTHFDVTKQGRKPQISGRDIATADDSDAKFTHVI